MTMFEKLEDRRLMSATLAADVEPEQALLLPAVQAAREAPKTTSRQSEPTANFLSGDRGDVGFVLPHIMVL